MSELILAYPMLAALVVVGAWVAAGSVSAMKPRPVRVRARPRP